MQIKKVKNDIELCISLIGRLDTVTAPSLEDVLVNELKEISLLVFDFKELDYVSSAGLRLVLLAQKTMNKQGSMVIKNMKDDVKEVFEMTGFLDILKVE